MRSDDIVNVMYRGNFPRLSQSACAQRFFNSEKAMQGNKIRRQIAFAELRSATSSVGSRRKKLLDDHVKSSKLGDFFLLQSHYSEALRKGVKQLYVKRSGMPSYLCQSNI
ncbi:hypothetical protein AVEN_116660-1 [Araneus ventricosus]|uniref:Uncharacterized protein n=1 Tax=Araneus ventricosus TaxID=182803 RepID=A0A4Y2TZ60_ARAVE|nr:hypothetical protein AVEN_116660-1 [Araneus ventricosus]